MIRIGVDVGGTFTDVVLMDDETGAWTVLKTPSTPQDPSIGVVDGIDEALTDRTSDQVTFLGHGTTAGTNAFIVKAGARTALLATEGFRDVLEFRRMDRGGVLDPYDLQIDFPQPLVPGRRRLSVHERIGSGGEVVTALSLDEIERVVHLVEELGAEAVAICLLWSIANPEHERQLASALERALPELFVTVSSAIDPAIMEYERTSTTVVNAYLGPLIRRYLSRLQDEISDRQLPAPRIMQSNGGLTSIESAMSRPAALLESGPAAGVTACSYLAGLAGYEDVLAVDMGGTSFDVALVLGGEPQTNLVTDLEGYAVRIPMLDIRSIGAGGGSIAWVDDAGGLRVGPLSAGSTPGPACYGRGGVDPTVSDANVVLGYLNALTGGGLVLDRPAAERAFTERLSAPLGLSVVEAASGVYRLANTHMADLMRVMAGERGIDPKDLVLMAYGGAGPTHAAALAREMEMSMTIIPQHPGGLSALGVATADFVHDLACSVLMPMIEIDANSLEAQFARMESDATAMLEREGCVPDELELQRSFVARYIGQLHDLEVRVPRGELTQGLLEKVTAGFHDQHRTVFGFAVEDEPVLVISGRVKAIGRIPKPNFRRSAEGATPGPVGSRQVWFEETGFADCDVYDRADWRGTETVTGPSVIQEYDSTTIVLPGQVWHVDDLGSIVIKEEI